MNRPHQTSSDRPSPNPAGGASSPRLGRTLVLLGVISPWVLALAVSCGGDGGSTSAQGGMDAGVDAGGSGGSGGSSAGSGGKSGSGGNGGSAGKGSGGSSGSSGSGGTGGTGGEGGEPQEPCTPTGPEECDGIDNDCNGLIDDGLGVEVRRTSDGFIVEDAQPCDRPDDEDDCLMGRWKCSGGAVVCDEPDGRDPSTGQGGAEICDGIDNNCNGQIDEGFGVEVRDAATGAVLLEAQACDGPDTDLCPEGVLQCDAFGGVKCSDTTGNNVEICNFDANGDPIDDDCNPETQQVDLPSAGKCATECGVGELLCTGPLDENGQRPCSAGGPGTAVCTTNLDADADCNGIKDYNQVSAQGAVPFYKDDDEDGYPVENEVLMLCPNQTAYPKYIRKRDDNKWDCCDSDKQVHPDQGGWFSSKNNCNHYDYNCSNKEEKEPTIDGVSQNQCYKSCIETANGQRGWDEFNCEGRLGDRNCDYPCGRTCLWVHNIPGGVSCIAPENGQKTVRCH